MTSSRLQTSCDSAIRVERLAKRYGPIAALRECSLEVGRGELFGLLGPNGAGKTTAVKMLAGLVRPSGGSGTVLGYPLGDRRGRRRLGYLPELFRYQEWLSAREVLRLHADLCGGRIDEREISRLLELVGLLERADSRVATFSKGMQQRLGLAVAMLGQPELIVLDEPTSALDPIGRLEVRELLRTLKAAGTTVFLNSHLLTEVERICDRVAIVARGRIAAQGTIASIVGPTQYVCVRAAGDGVTVHTTLQRFGEVKMSDDAFIVRSAPERVPDIVAALVGSGARVHAIEPIAPSLEERFLQLTRDSAA